MCAAWPVAASLYKLRDRSEDFARICDLALATYKNDLFQEAMARALSGKARPVTYRGRIVGERVIYSNRLLAAALFHGDRLYGGVKLTDRTTE